MACRQCHEHFPQVVEEGIGGDDEPGSMQFYERGKGGVDLAFGASPQDRELHALRTRLPDGLLREDRSRRSRRSLRRPQ